MRRGTGTIEIYVLISREVRYFKFVVNDGAQKRIVLKNADVLCIMSTTHWRFVICEEND